jgi:hypothetical protein
MFILKGYGNSINYRMGVPLLEDVVQSMEEAIKAKEGNYKSSNAGARVLVLCRWLIVSLSLGYTVVFRC